MRMLLIKYLETLGREVRDSILRMLREYSEALVLAIILAIIIRFFVFSAYKISNVTMEPNLKLGDFVIGYRLPYGIGLPFSEKKFGASKPARGDIVVLKCRDNLSQYCVKRVVGLAGDRIEIRGKNLVINNRRSTYRRNTDQLTAALAEQSKFTILTERWSQNPERRVLISAKKEKDFGPFIVPPQSFFVLGDNRDFSEDSRHWGAIPYSAIESRLLFTWFSVEWSQNSIGDYSSRVRWERIFSPVK